MKREDRQMRPKRRFGQNFLTGTHYPERIVERVAPLPGEEILEIGPGEGALTGLLLARGARVTAIEIDADLLPRLESRFGADPRFRLRRADALTVDFCALFPAETRVRVVANLPYYISTPLVQRLIDHRGCISEMTLMLQREVVERMTAPPGGKEYGYLSVLTQFYCVAERLFEVPPGAFRPAPKVTSSVVRLRLRPAPAVAVAEETGFLTVCQSLFAQRRKTIFNNLRASQHRLGVQHESEIAALLAQAGIDGRRRAETLSLAELADLANTLFQMRKNG